MTDEATQEPAQEPAQESAPHVQKPGWFTVKVLNGFVAWLTRRGISLKGSRILEVRGRKSGQWRRTPVNVLTLGSERYLVAPRGHVQWTYNMRAAGGGRLVLGKATEEFTAEEVADEEKPTILRGYLERWKAETGVFFDGVGPDSPEERLREIAPKHPVFRISGSVPAV